MTTADAAATPRKSAEEEMVVTGSRVRRKDLTTPAPVTVLSREQWQASGKMSIGEFLQTMPEQGNGPNFQLNNGGINYSAAGSTNINLRSLGITRSLVLVNGRRMVPSGVGADAAVDLNTIPAAAVERIEVLKDGASAIYGSDAIAGVVNIITFKRFNGTQASAQYGISDKGDAQTFEANVATGRSGDLGNFFFSATYFNQKDSWLRDRDFAKQALEFDYSAGTANVSGSGRTPQGTIALPTDSAGNELAACAANPVCHALVTGNPDWNSGNFIRCNQGDTGCLGAGMGGPAPFGFRPFTGADRYNYAAENYLTIPATRVQVFSAGDTHVSAVRGYYEVSYVQRNTQQNAAPMPLNPGDYTLGDGVTPIQLSKDSLYNPFGVDLPFAGRRLVEFGRRTYTQELATFRIVTGLDGVLPDVAGPLKGWYWDASMNYGRTSGTFTTGGALRNSRVAAAVGPSMLINGVPRCVQKPGDASTVIPGCVPINLLGGANNGSIDPSQIGYLGYSGVSRAFDAMFSAGLNATGELFNIASDRPVSLALGYEFRRQSGAQIADPVAASGDSADFNFASTQGFFTVHEAFAELSVPLLANLPLVQDLEASVAGRYVNYNTFGDNFSYKLGARYTPVPDITLRGTFSTAFRAPSINELYLGQTDSGPNATDPCANLSVASPELKAQCIATGVPAAGSADTGTQELAHLGGNPQLKAETAKIFTAGIVVQPRMLRNLSITVDYYNMTVDNLVGTIGTAAIIAGCYPGASGQPNQQYCSLIHRSPIANGGRILFVNDVNQNVGELKTAGIDFAIRYGLPTDFGRFTAGFDGTWLAYFDRTQADGSVIHGKGIFDLGALPQWKANLGVNWSAGGWSAGVMGRYIGNFTECSTPAPDLTSSGGLCSVNDPTVRSREVGHNVTFDAHAGYVLTSAMGKTSFNVGVNNVFDQAPPFVYSAPLANTDALTYDLLGRYVYGRVQHSF